MHNLVFFIALIFILWIGRSIFIPLLFATFLWYLLNAISAYYRRIMPCYKSEYCTITIKKFYNFLSIILSFATIGGIIYLFATQIRPMLSELYNSTPVLQEKLLVFSEYISKRIGVDIDMSLMPNLPEIAGYVGSSLASLATSTGMVLIYLIFMFVEQSSFNKKIDAMPLSKLKSKKLHYILSSIDENMKNICSQKHLSLPQQDFVRTYYCTLLGLNTHLFGRL